MRRQARRQSILTHACRRGCRRGRSCGSRRCTCRWTSCWRCCCRRGRPRTPTPRAGCTSAVGILHVPPRPTAGLVSALFACLIACLSLCGHAPVQEVAPAMAAEPAAHAVGTHAYRRTPPEQVSQAEREHPKPPSAYRRSSATVRSRCRCSRRRRHRSLRRPRCWRRAGTACTSCRRRGCTC